MDGVVDMTRHAVLRHAAASLLAGCCCSAALRNYSMAACWWLLVLGLAGGIPMPHGTVTPQPPCCLRQVLARRSSGAVHAVRRRHSGRGVVLKLRATQSVVGLESGVGFVDQIIND
eukprot:jgi/Ulvmu1/1577/UM111_0005.1